MFSFSIEMIDHTTESHKRLDLSFTSLSNAYSHPYRDRQLASRGRSIPVLLSSDLSRSLKNRPVFIGLIFAGLQQYLGDLGRLNLDIALADGFELVWVFPEPKWCPYHAVRQRYIH